MLLAQILFLSLVPETVMLVFIVLILLRRFFPQGKFPYLMKWVIAIGIITLAVATLALVPNLKERSYLVGQILRIDMAAWVIKLVLIFALGITVLLSRVFSQLAKHEPYFVLLSIATLGLMLMVSASNLIVLYLAIEIALLPVYFLADVMEKKQETKKAFIFSILCGVVPSIILFIGFFLLALFSGNTRIDLIASGLAQKRIPQAVLIFNLVLVLAGLGLKILAVPFQLRLLKLDSGILVPFRGFILTGSITAAFVVLMRLLFSIFTTQLDIWIPVTSGLSVGCMVLGSLLAFSQKSGERFLIYSTINQIGMMLIGVASGSVNGISATVYFLMAYLVTGLAAFGCVMLVRQAAGTDEISAFAGLGRRSPGMAALISFSGLSLTGFPPFAGFASKLLVFSAAIQQGLTWLVFVAVVSSILTLYCTLNILKVVYLYHSDEENTALPLNLHGMAALILCSAVIIILGLWISPFYSASYQMSLNLLQLP